jgi:arylsulfatase A-like enzyme
MGSNQNRRQFLKTVGLTVAALAVPGCEGSAQRTVGKFSSRNPNIVFIMADDMGIGDTTVYNSQSKIPTPHMETLATQGVVFTDAHSPSSMCTPTRYALLTGRYCWRTWLWRGVYGGYNRPLIKKKRMTIASLLKKHGYATACVGKWHLGMDWGLKEGCTADEDGDYGQFNIDFYKSIKEGPLQRGFDYFFGTSGCTTDDPPMCFIENDRTVGIPSEICPVDPASEDRELLMLPGWRHEDADIEFTKKTVGFIEKHVKNNPKSPFFVYLPLSVPHIPWFPPDMVKGKSGAGPRGDQVVLADWSLGEVMKALDKLGIADNTLLIFTSDNGPREGVNGHESSWHYRGEKGDLWEGGHRIPFIARWPENIKAGTTCDELTCFTDMMATFAAIVGTDLPRDAGEDSFNILPVLLGKKLDKPVRHSLVHHNGQLAIRQGDWKLIAGIRGNGSEGGRKALFNLKADPGEKNNLFEEHPEIVERLTKLLTKQMEQGYSRPLKS